MSTATISHLPHTAHPVPLREQAFTLHCQGLRSPAIAESLGIPERTIRAWIAAALQDLKDDQQFSRREQLLLAVERQHALTAAAWADYETETAARAQLLETAFSPTPTSASTTESFTPATSAPTRPLSLLASTPAPRYLSLILAANKEVNRLLGLYTLAATLDKLDLLTPADPADSAPSTTSGSPLLAEQGLGIISPIPAESATASAAKPDIPAESATVTPSGSPLPAGEGLGVRSPIPAESATASAAKPRFAAESATAPSSIHRVRRTPFARTVPKPWMM